jgi:hypothetical protein
LLCGFLTGSNALVIYLIFPIPIPIVLRSDEVRPIDYVGVKFKSTTTVFTIGVFLLSFS